MTDTRRYASPQAFRRALTDRLGAVVVAGEWDLPQLQRQFAYDRLLARLYISDDAWIVKGATALIARGIAVRSTIDVDIYRERTLGEAEADLHEAVGRHIDDWFAFRLGPGQSVNDGSEVRIKVDASIGATPWARFHIDLVGSDLVMTGRPDDVPSIARIDMPQVQQDGYRAYPLADHIADKVCAILQRYGDSELPSTRFKDLVDLVAIVGASFVDADAATEALHSEAGRRGLLLPRSFEVPDRDLWMRGYAAEASRSSLGRAETLDEALAEVDEFINPILSGTATGWWDADAREWTASDHRASGQLRTSR